MHAPPTYSHHHSNQVDTCSVHHRSSHDPNTFQDSRSPARPRGSVCDVHPTYSGYEGYGSHLTHLVIRRTHNMACVGSVVERVFN